MNRPARSLHLALASSLLLLAACSSAPKQKQPFQLQLAEKHAVAGVDAESKQRYIASEGEFIEAYRLFASIENYHGMVATLLNSSRLYRRTLDLEKASVVLNQAAALVHHAQEFTPELYFEKSRLAAMKNSPDEALSSAEKALASSPDSDRSRMLNLVAAAHLKKGNLQKGGEIASGVLRSLKGGSDRREEANSNRILAEIAYLEKRNSEAATFYDSALLLDKELAISDRVAADLAGLSLVAESTGSLDASAGYLQRAVDAAVADRNIRLAREYVERLIILYKRTGKIDAAERVIKLKDTLR